MTKTDWRAWVDGHAPAIPSWMPPRAQLLATGFVHNRARMIAASFLAKHLLIDFRRGEEHYLNLLTDGDWANNDAGWQWSAGCGCDAQPWFRIFNPVTQGEKFDPEGDYVRALGARARAAAGQTHPCALEGARRRCWPPPAFGWARTTRGPSSITTSRASDFSTPRRNISAEGVKMRAVRRLRSTPRSFLCDAAAARRAGAALPDSHRMSCPAAEA